MEYINDNRTMNTGAGIIVEILTLKDDGEVLVSDDIIAMYADEEAFYNGAHIGHDDGSMNNVIYRYYKSFSFR